MLKLITSYSFTQVPYITYDALDEYAVKVIHDAAPELLKQPSILNVEWFVEYYLGMQIEYKRLSYDRKILGMTAFNTGLVQVVDEFSGKTAPVDVVEGTVLIDPILMEKRNAARRRFTFMHEGSHWLIHRPAFSVNNPFGSPGKYENQYLAAKEGRIDYSRSQKERNDSERVERQADFLASALLMPLPTLRMAFRNFFGYYGERPHQIVRGSSAADDDFASLLPEYVAGEFGVSHRAALIRLEKLRAIVGKSDRCFPV